MIRLKYQSFLDILSGGLQIMLSTRTPDTVCFSFLVLMEAMLLSIRSRSNYLHITITTLCNKMVTLKSSLNRPLIVAKAPFGNREALLLVKFSSIQSGLQALTRGGGWNGHLHAYCLGCLVPQFKGVFLIARCVWKLSSLWFGVLILAGSKWGRSDFAGICSNVFNNQNFDSALVGFLKYSRLRRIITQSKSTSISVFLFIYGSTGTGY